MIGRSRTSRARLAGFTGVWILSSIAMFAQNIPAHTPTNAEKEAEWFYRQRAYPLKEVPAGAHEQAVRESEKLQSTSKDIFGSQLVGGPPPTSTTWSPIGPQPTRSPQFGQTAGRVTAMAVDP